MDMATSSQAPARYEDFTQQFIAGEWRPGRSKGGPIVDLNPYDGSTLATTPAASVEDVADAYAAAVKAQPAWASSWVATPPSARS